jgi:CcmD family protein
MNRRVTMAIVTMLLMAGSVFAAVQPPPAAPGQGDFVPVSSVQAVEQLPAAPLLIGGYVVVWLALLVYVWSIWRRMKKIEHELADLQNRVQSR